MKPLQDDFALCAGQHLLMVNKFLSDDPVPPEEFKSDMDEAMKRAEGVSNSVCSTLNPHMTDKNQELLRQTMEKLSERGVWEDSLSAAEYKESNEVSCGQDCFLYVKL